jgi:para-aminobenzoate synthetase component 1
MPFAGGAAGYFGYEFGRFTETFPPSEPCDTPEAWIGFYDHGLAFDVQNGKGYAFACRHKSEAESLSLEKAQKLIELASNFEQPQNEGGCEVRVWHSNLSREAYEQAVESLRQNIFNGDVFQANIARQLTAERPENCAPHAFYKALRNANPAPFSAFLDCGKVQIACSSPERFLKLEGNKVEARPIKGTIARNDTNKAADAKAQATLKASAKDIAENTMIVDLLRNDLSKVCKPFSVKVPSLCQLESFANLHHLVSVVTGELQEHKTAIDLLSSSFPGGSITGAPKIKAMEFIHQLESCPRGVYCGSIGWIGINGDMDLNIAIRTAEFNQNSVKIGVGSGITWGSGAASEYQETQVKAARMLSAFTAYGHKKP